MFSLRTRLAALAGAAALVAAIAVPGSAAAAAERNARAQAGSNCLFSEGAYCYLESRSGFYAAGDTHGDTVGTESGNGSRYLYTPIVTSGGLTYGEISNTAGTLCWNLAAMGYVYMDSCNADDNELYAMVPCANGSWCISNFDDGSLFLLWGQYNDTPLYFQGGGPNADSEWEALSST
jgi:hypothetical protein